MKNNLKYTTEKLKVEIDKDENISKEEKDEEKKKVVITDDAFALCDYLNEMKSYIKLLWRDR